MKQEKYRTCLDGDGRTTDPKQYALKMPFYTCYMFVNVLNHNTRSQLRMGQKFPEKQRLGKQKVRVDWVRAAFFRVAAVCVANSAANAVIRVDQLMYW